MAFEDWFIAHARVSSKPHKGITLDDKMSFFHQLSTLVSSGTPLLQAWKSAPSRAKASSCGGCSRKSPRRVASGSSLHAAAANYPNVFQHHWIEVIRTGEITGQMSLVLDELNKQIHDSRATRRKIIGRHDVSDHPDLRRGARRDRHALAGRAHVRQDVQGHGGGSCPPSRSSSSTRRTSSSKYGIFVVLGIGRRGVRVSLVLPNRRGPPPRAWASCMACPCSANSSCNPPCTISPPISPCC